MELRTTRELRRNERLDKAMAKRADTSGKTDAQPARRQGADKCDLSRQALAYLEEQNRLQQKLDERRALLGQRYSEYQDKSAELELLKKGMDVLDKCLKIAAAIMRGDKVPMKDLKYLMENDAAGYKLAMALRREKKDPEEVDSVLDDEEQQGGSTEGGGEAAPAVSGGGEASGGSAAE